MRVLHVVESLSPKWLGLSRAVAGLAGAMAESGLEVRIITMSEGDEEQLQPEGVKIETFRRGPLAWWGYSRDVAPAMENAIRQVDLIHVHGLWAFPCFAASRGALRAGKPYVVSPHGMLDPWALNHKKMKKRIYAALIEWKRLKNAAAIHAVSDSEASSIELLNFGSPVFSIPNGINTREFSDLPERSRIINRFPSLSEKTILLFLAQIHPRKGLAILADAFCEIVKKRDDVALLIAGPDEIGYRKEMESVLNKGGATGRYEFAGMLGGEDRLAALASGDIFILPSYSEGHPVAAIEAMAAGLPVVLTEACNIPEVGDMGAGIVIPAEEKPLEDAILRLVDDFSMRGQMGQKGRELVMNHYTWEKVSARMVDVYKRVIKGTIP